MQVSPELGADRIRSAHGSIDPVFLDSPQFVHEGLSSRYGAPVIVKVEAANPIRSFKGRGTWIAVHALAEAGTIDPQRPVVCVSAGNFGQGVAFAARALGLPCVIFASRRANRDKVASMHAFGARVIEIGDTFDDARGESETYAAAEGLHLLVDGDDPLLSTGAATMAVEVTDAVERGALPEPAIVSVPVGNGSLINGIGAWMRASNRTCRVSGVQAEAAPAMTLSWRAGRPIDTETALTFADGIASRVAIPRAVGLMSGRVDDMRLVSEAQLRAAQSELTAQLGITVEGAAAASWAGLSSEGGPDGPALIIVTGSNS